MEHIKEMQLEILTKLNAGGKVDEEEFNKLFDKWEDYETIFDDLNFKYACIRRVIANPKYGEYDNYTIITNDGKVMLRQLEKEKMDEEAAIAFQNKTGKESSRVSTWTLVMGILTIAILVVALLTLYYTCNPPHKP